MSGRWLRVCRHGACAAVCWLVAVTAHGQEAGAAPQSSPSSPVIPAGVPGEMGPPGGLIAAQPPGPAEDTAGRTEFLEHVRFDFTWLPGGGREGFEVTDVELSATFAVPFDDRWAPLRVTPYFAAHFWGGPDSANFGNPDLPPRAYDVSVDFGWRPRFARWLFADLGLTPGLYTDFDEVNDSSFRLRGRGLAIIALSERFQFVAGVLYVNRNNVKLLPAGGILWNPNDRLRCELVFPQPKVSYRLGERGGDQWWAYVAGEFGGGAWTVERVQYGDSVDYSDTRVLLGVERVAPGGFKSHVEVGYVFGRKIDFVSATPDFDPEPTVMLRAGIGF